MPHTPPRRQRVLLGLIVAVLVIAGCGGDDPDTSVDTTTSTTTTTTTTGDDPATTVPSSPRGIAEALAIDDDDVHEVIGFMVTVEQLPRLCTTLAESSPPRCGEPSIALAGGPTSNLDDLFGDRLTTRAGVSWTAEPVVVTGAVIHSGTGAGAELWIAG